jgi:hypothetical protein
VLTLGHGACRSAARRPSTWRKRSDGGLWFGDDAEPRSCDGAALLCDGMAPLNSEVATFSCGGDAALLVASSRCSGSLTSRPRLLDGKGVMLRFAGRGRSRGQNDETCLELDSGGLWWKREHTREQLHELACLLPLVEKEQRRESGCGGLGRRQGRDEK